MRGRMILHRLIALARIDVNRHFCQSRECVEQSVANFLGDTMTPDRWQATINRDMQLATLPVTDPAQRLLAKQEIQAGLMKLWELNLLDHSVEALVIQEHFRPLFTEDEIQEARRRLEELGYFR